jgi:hypothetical protein
MELIRNFFIELDHLWKPSQNEKSSKKINLYIIGSSALLLQTQYIRGTKDSDVIETEEITVEIHKQLMKLGGKGSRLFKKHRLCIDIVPSSIPFLPQVPIYHSVNFNKELKNIEILVLDVVDVVVSKLKRFNASDVSDIKAMIDGNYVTHKKIVKHFKLAMDAFQMDARAIDFPKYIRNLNTVERDIFFIHETEFEIPHWI